MKLTLVQFINGCRKAKGNKPFEHWRILGLDPGETTGYCFLQLNTQDNKLCEIHIEEVDQCKTWPEHDCVNNISVLLSHLRPDIIVNESYRVYDWKSDDHKWSPVNTTQVIGSIWTQAYQKGIPRAEQSAQIAKLFWTDDRLHEFDLWKVGKRHGRDALRHALYYACFGGDIKS